MTVMDRSKPRETPICSIISREDAMQSKDWSSKDHRKYRSIVGSNMYFTLKTRSNMAVAASMLGVYVEHPTKKHMANAKRVLRYSKETE